MGVFDSDNNYTGEQIAKMDRCKRDYESEIASVRRTQLASESLMLAVDEYIDVIGRGNKTFTLTELYGALALEGKTMTKMIAHLQELWEREK